MNNQKEPQKNWLKFLREKTYILLIIAAVAGGGYYAYDKIFDSDTEEVRYVTKAAEKGTLTNSITASGNIIVDQLATVDPTITGTVAGLAIKVGDSVEEGEFLFNIVNDDLDVSVQKATASLQQAENSVRSAELAKKQAKADYDAAKKKDKDDGSSYTTEQLNVLKAKIDNTEDGIVAAQKDLIATRTEYQNQLETASKRKVVAPIDGTVNEINIKNGDDLGKTSSNSSDSQSPIIIGNLGTLKASIDVNEVDIPNVKLGQKVMLLFDAIENLTLAGKVEQIDSLGTSDQGVVTYTVTIAFDSLDPRIKPEMSVTAAIITEVKQDVLIVPTSAIKTANGTNYVEILNEDAPEKRNVEIGTSNFTEVEILSGLKNGDKVITQTIDPNSSTSTSSSSGSKSSQSGIRLPGLGGGRPD